MRLWWLVNHGLMLGSTVHQYHPIPSLCSTHPCEEKYKTVNNPILTEGWSGSVYNISVASFVIIQKVYQYERNFGYSVVVSGTPIYLCITFFCFCCHKDSLHLSRNNTWHLSKNRYVEKPVKLHVARAKMQIVLSAILHFDDDFVRKSGIFCNDLIIQKLLTITSALQGFQSQKCQYMSPSLFCKQNTCILIHFAYCYTFCRKFILVWQLF